jgi:D-alanyl-D-alanine dipeptidase
MIKFDRTKGRPEPIRALNRIREIENGEPLIDIREVAPSVHLMRPQVLPWVRLQVAEKVAAACERLPKGYRLGLIEGWRPLERQQRIWDFMWRCAREAFPDRDYASLRRTVCRWVAPTDQKAPPGHCTGAAVDVWLLNDSLEVVDVSAPFDRFRAAPTFSYGLTEEALMHRMMLYESMVSVGFSNCRDEWWHYSFGDAGWAVRQGLDTCIYGIAKMDPAAYAEQEATHIMAMTDRPNPFIVERPA